MFRHAGNFSKAELVSGIRPGVFESLSVFDHMVKQRTYLTNIDVTVRRSRSFAILSDLQDTQKGGLTPR